MSIGNSWAIQLKKKVERYEAVAGIEGNARREAQTPRAVGSYAGGPVRKMSSQKARSTPTQVAAWVMSFAGNFFTLPFRLDSNKDIIKFSQGFISELLKSKGPNITKNNRVINLMQAIIRNPILRGEYKMHSQSTAKKKGFKRSLIDTGQFFKSIKVVIKKRSGGV